MSVLAGLLSFVCAMAVWLSFQRRIQDPLRKRVLAVRTGRPSLPGLLRAKLDQELGVHLARGGFNKAKAIDFCARVVLLAAGLGAIGLLLFASGFSNVGLIAFGLGVAPMVAGPAWVSWSVARRLREIERQLPLFAECLAIGLEAGATLEMSLTRMAPRMHGPLGDELKRALQALRLGSTRREALWELARRVDLPELTSLVVTVVQSEELGAGFAKVIRTLAGQMRARQVQRAERLAAQAPVKILFPLIFFIFPSLLVLMLGPLLLGKGVN